MTQFACPTCGFRIHFLDNRSICLNSHCKDGYALIKSSQVIADQHRALQPPERRDEADSGGQQPGVLPVPGTGGVEEARSYADSQCYLPVDVGPTSTEPA